MLESVFNIEEFCTVTAGGVRETVRLHAVGGVGVEAAEGVLLFLLFLLLLFEVVCVGREVVASVEGRVVLVAAAERQEVLEAGAKE